LKQVKVRVLYFAQARQAAGTAVEEIPLPNPADLDGLLAEIWRLHPELTRMRGNLRVAVNQQLVEGNKQLMDGDEVALLPPVVGG
jgi:molybdopterin converting factor subunit 1